MDQITSYPAALAQARKLLSDQPIGGDRVVLGLCACPGAGKSTLAQRLVSDLGDRAVVIPMDGFHLCNDELQRLGLRQRKGASNTFDVTGFVSLLQRLRQPVLPDALPIYAPIFRRDLDESVGSALPVLPQHRLLIVEGNYLLLQEGLWGQVLGLLQQCWYLFVDDAERRRRLVQRHMQHGFNASQAQHWVQSSDELNAEQIKRYAHRAHTYVTLGAENPL